MNGNTTAEKNMTEKNTTMNNTTMMNTMKEMMSMDLIQVDELRFPLVKVAYTGKNGYTYHGVFVIDSGATNNQLNKTVLKRLSDDLYLENVSTKITGIQGEGSECKALMLDFKLSNGLDFSERFFASEMEMDFLGKGVITGILGIEFLRKYHLVLDFESKTLHTSTINKVEMDECDFCFDMMFGIKAYSVPLVACVNGDDMYFLIADSGANITSMTKHAMEECQMPLVDYHKDDASIDTVTGSVKADSCRSTLRLVSSENNEDGFKVINCEDEIQVISHLDFIVDAGTNDDGEAYPAISGMLSTGFMLHNKWILDFHHGVIYSRKKAA